MSWVSSLLQIKLKSRRPGERSSLSLLTTRLQSKDCQDEKPLESEGMCPPVLVRPQLLPPGGTKPSSGTLGQAWRGRGGGGGEGQHCGFTVFGLKGLRQGTWENNQTSKKKISNKSSSFGMFF